MPDEKGLGSSVVGPFGWGPGAYLSLAAAKTLRNADGKEPSNGMTYGLNAAAGFTVTLPSIAEAGAGWRARFRVETAPATGNYIITEKTADDTNVLTGGVVERETDTGDDGPYSAAFTQVNFIQAVAVVGDEIEIECNGSRFFVTGVTNADGGVTLT